MSALESKENEKETTKKFEPTTPEDLPEDRESSEESSDDTSEEDSDYEDGYEELKKFQNNLDTNQLLYYHPETKNINYKELSAMTKCTRDKDGVVVDILHRTVPFVTQYEKAKVIGMRAKQINDGAEPYIDLPNNIIDGLTIAELEFNAKKLPFIIRRPLPNGASEYWKLEDLDIL
jgi:DNA-directed RNA polymerase subunit K/omega